MSAAADDHYMSRVAGGGWHELGGASEIVFRPALSYRLLTMTSQDQQKHRRKMQGSMTHLSTACHGKNYACTDSASGEAAQHRKTRDGAGAC